MRAEQLSTAILELYLPANKHVTCAAVTAGTIGIIG